MANQVFSTARSIAAPNPPALQASTRNLPGQTLAGQNPARKTKEPVRWRPRIGSHAEFDSLARIYYQGRFYALPHLMFVIDRAAKEGAGGRVYYVNSKRYSFHCEFANANYLTLERGREFFRRNYLEANRRFILREPPISLTPLQGVITTTFSTPLAHANLLAKGWGAPNAYIKDADRLFEPLKGRFVYFETREDGYTLRPAETDETLEAGRRLAKRSDLLTPEADLEFRQLTELKDQRKRDSKRFGAKSANLGEIIHAARIGAARVLTRSGEDTMLTFDERGGVREIKISTERRVLTDAVVRRLARAALQIERAFGGRDQDIEWITIGNQIYIVQSRPYVER